MLRFIAVRVLWFIPTIIAVSAITFLMIQATPGSPFQPESANQLRPEAIAAIEAKYGLDQPLPVQYYNYFSQAVTGDFGQSYQYRGQEVSDIIRRTFPISFHLGVMALAFAAVGGIILGILSAVKQNGFIDYSSVTIAVLFYSVPNFVLGFLLILIFAFWLPEYLGVEFFNIGGWQSPRDWILPTIALGAAPLAVIARYTRSSMIDVIRSDYVRTARAKGLAERKIVVKHVLKNALIPVITLLGPLLAALATGSFFVEQIFNVPGMGKFFVQSMRGKDQPMILAVVLVYGVFLAIMNLVVDVLYGVIDPRIRLT
jgi:ABC-type dipeptide/oligopeptide/nickel transport system permease component